MVYKPSAKLQSPIEGPCEKIRSAKRPLCIGANIEQKPWKPTVRKGRIAAEQIPGNPAYRNIPPYIGPNVKDSNKKSAPAYSFGRKITRKHGPIEDGPAKFDIYGFSSKGLHKAPSYSLRSRAPDLTKPQAPASSKYSVNKALKATIKSLPTFSFGKKPATLKTMATPAPNVYNLPPVFGTAKEGKIKAAPAFSMTGRPKPREIPALILPGPGEYEDNYRFLQKVPPSYTLRIKHKVISDEHMKPGPAAHCAEKFYKHKSVPAPSFSTRYTPYLGLHKAHLMHESPPYDKPAWIL